MDEAVKATLAGLRSKVGSLWKAGTRFHVRYPVPWYPLIEPILTGQVASFGDNYVRSNAMEKTVPHCIESISWKEQISGIEQERTKLDQRVDEVISEQDFCVIFFLALSCVVPISHGKSRGALRTPPFLMATNEWHFGLVSVKHECVDGEGAESEVVL